MSFLCKSVLDTAQLGICLNLKASHYDTLVVIES